LDFVLLLLSLTCLFVVITGIQFWSTDYFVSVLGVKQSMAYKYFFVVGAIGPITGVLFAGFVFDRFGGYNGPQAIPIISGFGFIALIAAISSTISVEPMHVAACMTIQLFCGGFIMPAATGLMLNQVPSTMRTVSNSIANLSYNLFGYVPAPYLYGYIY
jgi:MFS family permease